MIQSQENVEVSDKASRSDLAENIRRRLTKATRGVYDRFGKEVAPEVLYTIIKDAIAFGENLKDE